MKNYFNLLFIVLMISCSTSDSNENENSDDNPIDENPISETTLLSFKKQENSLDDIPTDIIEIDKTNGQETQIAQIENISSLSSTIVDVTNNKLFAIADKEDENGDYTSKLITLDLDSYTAEPFQLEAVHYYTVFLDRNNVLYALKKLENSSDDVSTKIVRLNKTNGQETLVAEIPNISSISSLAVDYSTNVLFAIADKEDENGDYVSKLVKIDLSDFNSEVFQLDSLNYYNLFLANDNLLYATKKLENSDEIVPTKIVALNKTNGEETQVAEIENIASVSSLAMELNMNILYAIADKEDAQGDYVSTLIKIDLSSYDADIYQLDNLNYYTIFIK